jgi:hypothetical protein
MKVFLALILLIVNYALAEDFSIYPLTPETLEFSTQFETPFDAEGYAQGPYSMQYVYPDEATLYSMQFVEPDPNTEFSMYTSEPTLTVPEFELEFPNP